MIDSIASQSGIDGSQLTVINAENDTNLIAQESEQQLTANGDIMNKAELQAKHPELYAEIKAEGVTAGKAEGKQAEQKRVSALAEAGEAFGAQELAMACIQDGSEIDAALNLRFASAQAKNNKLNAMASDNVDAEGITPEAPKAEANTVDAAAQALADEMGVEL